MTSPTAAVVTSLGISAPSYEGVLTWLQGQYQSIYGADIYIDPDSKDGQFLAVIASAINDCNASAISVYNSFSPATGQGNGLSSNVKINGIARAQASNSTADILIVGQAGTAITNGIVSDTSNNRWALPANVTIPPAGQITVTATCQTLGAVVAAAGTISAITTPTLGWQSATNPAAAAPGAPVETDAQLRVRQQQSVALPSLTVLAGIVGAVEAISGVTEAVPYENDTGTTDSNGLPPHSISLVVEGGDATAIATAIMQKKTPGAYTYGTTVISVTDSVGVVHPIRFYRPTNEAITVAISVKALNGYTSAIGTSIQQAVSDYINGTPIGGGAAAGVEWDSSISAAKSVSGSGTFKIESLTLTGPGGAGTPDVPLAFNQNATCTPASVVLTVS